ncbi:MAG: hypothetical protein AAF989_00180 [Planctomycetota bacterium]
MVNRSLGDLLSAVEYVNDLVEQLRDDPNVGVAGLADELRQILGLTPEEFDLSYDGDQRMIRLELNAGLTAADNETASFSLDLTSLGLSDELASFADEFVDFSGQGSFVVSAGADLRVHLGLALDDLQSGGIDDALYVLDTTGVFADFSARADALEFETSILGFGIEADGRAALDADGVRFDGGAENNGPGGVSISARDDWQDGRRRLRELSPGDFQFNYDVAAGIDLTLTTLTSNPVSESLQLKWDDLSSLNFDVLPAGTTVDPSGGNQIAIPDFGNLIGNVGDNLSLADGLRALGTGLQSLFGIIDDYLGDEVLGIPVPLIGEGLSDVVRFVDEFVIPISQRLEGVSTDDAVEEIGREILLGVLGPGIDVTGDGVPDGLNLLRDLNGDGEITIEDVEATLRGEDEFSFAVRIGNDAIQASAPIDLDVGGSVLGLDLEGDVAIRAGYGIDLVVGMNLATGPFVEFGPNNDIELDFLASIDDLTADATLGPLAITVSTIDASDLSEDQRRRSRLVADDPSTETINAIRGGFGLNFPEGRYSLTELPGVLSMVRPQAELVGSLHTHFVTGVNTSVEGIPTIVGDLHLNFDRVPGDGTSGGGSIAEVFESLSRPSVELSDVGLDLGSFVSDVLAPILEPVNDFLDPIRPILDQLTAPIPVISDLIGEVTLLDFVNLFGEGGETVVTFAEAVTEIVDLIDIPLTNQSVILPLGNFETLLDEAGDLVPMSTGGNENLERFVDGLDDQYQEIREYIRSIPQEDPVYSESGELVVSPGMFSLPILKNPASAINVLFGKDVDLVRYQAPRLEARFDFSQSIPVPIFPAIQVTFGGGFSAGIDFAFGYDTAGIRQFASSGNPFDLLDGFFFDDRVTFRKDENDALVLDDDGNPLIESDVPELTFRFEVTAGGSLNLFLVSAGVEGGIGAQLTLDLNDPNLDGKVRFDEVFQNLQLGNAPGLGPLWVFDASGQLDAFLRAYVSAFGVRASTTIGPFVIVDYDFPRPEASQAVLGHVESDGQLVVHTGPRSGLRVEGDLTDGDDVVFISTDQDTGETILTGFGTDQRFVGVRSVLIDTGDGDDIIVVDPSFELPVTALGGLGNDEISGGAGPLLAYGGGGNDTIIGGTANDVLFGNGLHPILLPSDADLAIAFARRDDDLIDGGEGDDEIHGGDGRDQLQGGRGNDRLDGGTGRDNLVGGLGDDVLIGGRHNDVLSGEDGNDHLYGDNLDGTGAGRDVLQGGSGDDVLRGAGGNDQLFGGLGADQLFGQSGDDMLVGAVVSRGFPDFLSLQPEPDTSSHFLDGGVGNDIIHGTAGVDEVQDLVGTNRVFTYEGNDRITTGAGDDLIRAGSGDDVIQAGNGDNQVFGGEGFDIVDSGVGNDLIDLRVPSGSLSRIANTGSQITILGGNNRVWADGGDDIIDVLTGGVNFIDAGGGDNRVTTTGFGGDTIRTLSGDDVIDAGDGDNEISVGAGDDVVRTGFGNDNLYLGAGNDHAISGAGDDVIVAGFGNDFVDAGSGSDLIRGDEGDDQLIGGIGSDTIRGGTGRDVIWGGRLELNRDELEASRVPPVEYDPALSSVTEFPSLVPSSLVSGSLAGSFEDGNDLIEAGPGNDLVFGGGGNDFITGDEGQDYLDGGLGDDNLSAGDDQDVVRGGRGDDLIVGGAHLDFLYGDEGDDGLRGDAGFNDGDGQHQTYGQSLFGGPGNDVLEAYAHTLDPAETAFLGDRLDGGEGADELRGNLRAETMFGGGGDDRLLGDFLAGPVYALHANPFTLGGDDVLLGGFGDDLLQGGGGDDQLWGGGNSDELEGHAGQDVMYGGGGIDFFHLDVAPEYGPGGDVIDGHFGNAPGQLGGDDFATDILGITGTTGDDVIKIAGSVLGQAEVLYGTRSLPVVIRDTEGRTLVEQFQIDGLGGNDHIEMDASFDVTDLNQRSRDWVAVFNGGSGDDTLIGAGGRDRLDGGPGSDHVFGFGGDDRLWGDSGGGRSTDTDRLYAGTGNDDLLGGVGVNHLYAWSSDPGVIGPDFGIVGEDGELEDTGLNRLLGRDQDDLLFAGPGLDFMYGGEGNDFLHDVNGRLLENFGVPESEQWLEYVRRNDAVWYYGGTDRDDVITVDYVTEPGLLGGHHLITRLTENDGFFSFDARVQLDFAATHPDGSLVWDPNDLVNRIEELDQVVGSDARRISARSLELSGDLLPPEGDFTAIVINARDGDDQVFVGPTVQRTVFTAAGAGNDVVEYASGTALLVDLADSNRRNESVGDPSDFTSAFELRTTDDDVPSRIDDTIYFEKLTLDSPGDVDWFTFVGADLTPASGAQLVVDSLSGDDQIELSWYIERPDKTVELLERTTSAESSAIIDATRRSRSSISIAGHDFIDGTRYYVRVRSLNDTPTTYNLGIDLAGDVQLADSRRDLGVETDTFRRRDVIVGGPGDDILRGGPSEDWVIGGEGNDIITGGIDGTASDILIGEAGDDVFQIIPTSTGAIDLTLADEVDGGAGDDRVLFLGGDLDQHGRAVPDIVTLRYQPLLNVYTIAAKVWDTTNQSFVVEGDAFKIHTARYRTRAVEATEFDTRAGADEVRLDQAGFQFLRPDGSADETETYGVMPGDRHNGGGASRFIIRGGDGNDRLVGSPFADVISGGNGLDLIIGGAGPDWIDGDGGDDLIVGDSVEDSVSIWDRLEISGDGTNDTPNLATPLDFSINPTQLLTLHDGDKSDWYLVLPPTGSERLDVVGQVDLNFIDPVAAAIHSVGTDVDVEIIPAVFDVATGTYVPTPNPSSSAIDGYFLHVDNPTTRLVVGNGPLATDRIPVGDSQTISFNLTVGNQPSQELSIEVNGGEEGTSVAAKITDAIIAADFDVDPRVHYDDARDRLILQPTGAGDLRIEAANVFNYPILGFDDGQISTGMPYGLGGYTLESSRTFPPREVMGPHQESTEFVYPTASRDLASVLPMPTTDLADQPRLIDLSRIEGSTRDERLSKIVAVGDLNNDGREDFLLATDRTGYVFLGDHDTSIGLSSVDSAADLIIHYAAGTEFIEGPVDLDGDGFDDLTYTRTVADPTNGNGFRYDLIVLAASGKDLTSGTDQAVTSPQFNFIEPLDRDFSLIGTQLSRVAIAEEVDLDINWFRFNADESPDLAIFARRPVLNLTPGGPTRGYGLVKDGVDLADRFESVNVFDTTLLTVSDFQEDAFDVGSSIHEVNTFQYDQASGSDEIFATPADLDGDGLEELLLTSPRGWEFQVDASQEVVARTYRIAPNQTRFNIDLGSVHAPVIFEQVKINQGQREGGTAGALNVDLPLVVEDFDRDGHDDVLVITDSTGATGQTVAATLEIYSGIEWSGSLDEYAERVPTAQFGTLGTNGATFFQPSVTTGDFDGDGHVDFAITGRNTSPTIFYDAMVSAGLRTLDTSLGDARLDSQQIQTFERSFDGLPGHAIDVNGDGIHDLLLGESSYNTSEGALRGGAVHIVAGSPRVIGIPGDSAVRDLSDFNLRGFGDVVRDSNGPIEISARLAQDTDADWYRFRTAGRGRLTWNSRCTAGRMSSSTGPESRATCGGSRSPRTTGRPCS